MDGNDRHADARSWNLTPRCLFNFETRCARSESTSNTSPPTSRSTSASTPTPRTRDRAASRPSSRTNPPTTSRTSYKRGRRSSSSSSSHSNRSSPSSPASPERRLRSNPAYAEPKSISKRGSSPRESTKTPKAASPPFSRQLTTAYSLNIGHTITCPVRFVTI